MRDIRPYHVLRIVLGGTILSGGLFKVFFHRTALAEYSKLGLPAMLILPMTCFEIACGILLLLDRRAREAGIAFVVFAAAAAVLALVRLSGTFASRASEPFELEVAPKDVLLYALLGLMAVVMLMLRRRRH